MRGNLFNDFLRHAGCRSIPERAGEPFSVFHWSGRRAVYPRACGGTAPLFGTASLQYGLSPRVRGNLVDQPQYPESKRSIPARAGESESHGLCSVVYWVYPRACGGTIPLMCCVLIFTGLSSRVRGNLSSSLTILTSCWSILARAGEPIKLDLEFHAVKVYPRACGRIMGGSPAPRSAELEESSPLGRGPRAERRREDGLNRPT